jgi:hypothetical protein
MNDPSAALTMADCPLKHESPAGVQARCDLHAHVKRDTFVTPAPLEGPGNGAFGFVERRK